MAKDSYWFKHDSTSGRGKRIRKIQFIYTHWGKGIYWDVIEYLREQDGYIGNKDEFNLRLICDMIGCKDEPKFLSWFNDCIKEELFLIEGDYFYSEVLLENMKRWELSKENGKKGGNPNFKKGEPNPYYKGEDNPKDKGVDNPSNKGDDKHKSIEEDITEDIYTSFKHLKLTKGEFDRLISDGYTKQQIDDKISAIQNFKKNTNYVSLNLTIRNWLKGDGVVPQKTETLEERALRLRGQ